jgi:hypothetical protein
VGIRALLVCAGATALIVVGAGPVIGEDEDLSRARAACESRGTDAAKLEGMRALVAIDSAASRRTLEGYAQGRDRRLAAAAIGTIGRADYAGARGKLRGIFEDEDLPHASRALAFAAWARLEIASGSSWSAVESYGREHCEAGSALLDSVLAAKNALAPETTGGR